VTRWIFFEDVGENDGAECRRKGHFVHLYCMTRYDITDTVWVDAPAALLFEVLTDFEQFPAWWPKRYRTVCKRSNAQYVGREVWLRPNPSLTIGWRIIEAHPNHAFKLAYSQGWHTGYGKWTFEPEGSGTRLAYHIDIVPKNLVYAWIYRLVNLRKRHSKEMQLIMQLLATRVGAPAPKDFVTVNA
jgi:uncharacterized protein YndB with AHSA1/START domain